MKLTILMLVFALCINTNPSWLEAPHATGAEFSNPAVVMTRSVSINFTGTVKSIDLYRNRELSVVPVDFDPRFVVHVHIESVTRPGTPLKEGEDVVFAVHSPVRLFLVKEEEVIGKKYLFKASWQKVRGTDRFRRLTARALAN